MTDGRARQPELAFLYRDTAEKERRFGEAAGRLQLAFVYRNTAEKERRFGGTPAVAAGRQR